MANKGKIEYTVEIDAEIKNFESKVKNLETELNKIQLPQNAKNSFDKSLDTIYTKLEKYQKLASQPVRNQSDMNKQIQLLDSIKAEYNALIRSMTKYSKSDISLKDIVPKEAFDQISKLIESTKEYGAVFDKQTKKIMENQQKIADKEQNISKAREKQRKIEQEAEAKGAKVDKSGKKYTGNTINSADAKYKKAQNATYDAQRAVRMKEQEIQSFSVDVDATEAIAELEQLKIKAQECIQTEEQLRQEFETAVATRSWQEQEAVINKNNKNIQTYEKNIEEAKEAMDFSDMKKTLPKSDSSGFGIDQNTIDSYDQLITKIDQLIATLQMNFSTQMSNAVNVAKEATPALDDLGTKTEEAAVHVDKLTESANELSGIKEKFVSFFGISNGIDIFKSAIRNAYKAIQELDAVMTETAVVTDFKVSDMWDQLPEYTKLANELGVATKESYEAAMLYYQQGLSTNSVMQLTNSTLKMARIAGLDAAEATDRMTNALRGFNMQLTETNAERVADVYSELAAVSATDVDELSTAMTKVASIADSANMSFENTSALLAQMLETTRESAETAGTALKTVIARFSEVKGLYTTGQLTGEDSDGENIDVNKISAALRTAGIDMGQYFAGNVGLDEIFFELSQKWDTLTETQQKYIATQAAGSRQQSRFIAMMQDYDRLTELQSDAYNAAGASDEQYADTLDSLETKLTKLENAWNEFTMGIMNSTALKQVVDWITEIINLINNLTSTLGGFGKIIGRIGVLVGGLFLGKKILSGDIFSSFVKTLTDSITKGFTDSIPKARIAGKNAGQQYVEGVEEGKKQTEQKKQEEKKTEQSDKVWENFTSEEKQVDPNSMPTKDKNRTYLYNGATGEIAANDVDKRDNVRETKTEAKKQNKKKKNIVEKVFGKENEEREFEEQTADDSEPAQDSEAQKAAEEQKKKDEARIKKLETEIEELKNKKQAVIDSSKNPNVENAEEAVVEIQQKIDKAQAELDELQNKNSDNKKGGDKTEKKKNVFTKGREAIFGVKWSKEEKQAIKSTKKIAATIRSTGDKTQAEIDEDVQKIISQTDKSAKEKIDEIQKYAQQHDAVIDISVDNPNGKDGEMLEIDDVGAKEAQTSLEALSSTMTTVGSACEVVAGLLMTVSSILQEMGWISGETGDKMESIAAGFAAAGAALMVLAPAALVASKVIKSGVKGISAELKAMVSTNPWLLAITLILGAIVGIFTAVSTASSKAAEREKESFSSAYDDAVELSEEIDNIVDKIDELSEGYEKFQENNVATQSWLQSLRAVAEELEDIEGFSSTEVLSLINSGQYDEAMTKIREAQAKELEQTANDLEDSLKTIKKQENKFDISGYAASNGISKSAAVSKLITQAESKKTAGEGMEIGGVWYKNDQLDDVIDELTKLQDLESQEITEQKVTNAKMEAYALGHDSSGNSTNYTSSTNFNDFYSMEDFNKYVQAAYDAGVGEKSEIIDYVISNQSGTAAANYAYGQKVLDSGKVSGITSEDVNKLVSNGYVQIAYSLISEGKQYGSFSELMDDVESELGTRMAGTLSSLQATVNTYLDDFLENGEFCTEAISEITSLLSSIPSLYGTATSAAEEFTNVVKNKGAYEQMAYLSEVMMQATTNIDDLQSTASETLSTIEDLSDALGDVADAIAAQGETAKSAIGLIDDDYTVLAENLDTVRKIYPEMLIGAQVYANGTVKLNKEVVDSTIAASKAELTADAETTIGQLENNNKILAAKRRQLIAKMEMLDAETEAEGDLSSYKDWLTIFQGNSEYEAAKQSAETNKESTDVAITNSEKLANANVKAAEAAAKAWGTVEEIKAGTSVYNSVDFEEWHYSGEETTGEEGISENEDEEDDGTESEFEKEKAKIMQQFKDELAIIDNLYASNIDSISEIKSGIYNVGDLGALLDDGSSSSTADDWKNELDQFYNLEQDITAEKREQEKIEKELKLLESQGTASGQEKLDLLKKQINSMQKQKAYYQAEIKARKEEMALLMAQNAAYSDYVWYDSETGEVQIDYKLINDDIASGKIDETTYKAIEDLIEDAEEIDEHIEGAEDGISEIDQSMEDLENEYRDAYIEFEQSIFDKIVEQKQKEIDAISDVSDAIDDANTKLIDSINQQLEEERQARQNEETEEDLTDLQSRISYLSMDTSGANDLEIMSLQKEYDDMRQSYTDTLIDQKINELEEQNDNASEERQAQIELMQAQLELEEANGAYWPLVQSFMETGFDEQGNLIVGSQLEQMFNEDWNDSLSETQAEKAMEEFKNKASSAWAYMYGEDVFKTDVEDVKGDLSTEYSTITSGFSAVVAQVGQLAGTLGNYLDSLGDGAADTDTTVGDNYEESSLEDTKMKVEKGDKTYTWDEAQGKMVESGVSQQEGYQTASKVRMVTETDSEGNSRDVKYYTDSSGTIWYKDEGYNDSRVTGVSTSVNTTKKPTTTTTGWHAAQLGKGSHCVVTEDWDKVHDIAGSVALKGTNESTMQYATGKRSKLYGNAMKASNLNDYDDLKNTILDFSSAKVTSNRDASAAWNYGGLYYISGILYQNDRGGWVQAPTLCAYATDLKFKYAEGGVADFTGPAWLDGTKSRPEYVLNATQTQGFLNLVDILDGLRSDNYSSSSQSLTNSTNNNTINIDAQISNDYDVDQLTERIKKNLFESGTYRNVTQVNRLR